MHGLKTGFILALALLFTSCGAPAPASSQVMGGSTRREAVASGELQFQYPSDTDPTAIIETTLGSILVALYPQQAPLAVENFCALAAEGYYNSTTVHRVVSDFLIQAGRTNEGGDTSLWGHTFATEYSSELYHFSGALCMAAADNQPNTHLSQFYILATPQNSLNEQAIQQLQDAGYSSSAIDAYQNAGGAPYLDNTDTVFGQVVEGMDIVDEISRLSADENGLPNSEVQILSITIENYAPYSDAQSNGSNSTPLPSTPASA